MPTSRAINLLQFFHKAPRSEGQDPGSDRPLTFHGLRHTYAAEEHRELNDGGMDAHFTVAQLLGHELTDVTNISLASSSAKGMKDRR